MNLSSSEGDIETSEKLATAKNNLASTGIQTQTIPYDNTYSITATLVPVKASLSGTAALNPMAAATELKSGIRYKVLVYDSNSKLVDQKNLSTNRMRQMALCWMVARPILSLHFL